MTVDPKASIDKRLLLKSMVAVKNGDFTVRLPNDWTGIDGKIADAFNEIVTTNQEIAHELERVNKEVGIDGKTFKKIVLNNSRGSWAIISSSTNDLIENLIRPIREMLRVINAVGSGDLTQSMLFEVENRQLKGEYLRIAKTMNKMVTQLSNFAVEVIRVSHEVGIDGKLGGQAKVKDFSGTWKELTENVNLMASNLTVQVRNIAEVTTAVAKGDLSKKITVDAKGEILELKSIINTMVEQLNAFSSEVTRVSREVGIEGKLGGQATVSGASGVWKNLTENVNLMASNLTAQVRNIAEVTTAVAKGDLSKKITVDAKGEILELKSTVNTMVNQLIAFSSEVTRVAREVGLEGKLGGQAVVPEVSGVWKDLTLNVNSMASHLTDQVRNIAQVAIAVANGDLSEKITVDVRGELLQLKEAINMMVDQLRSFSQEVTRVARMVGDEGKLGEQADVKDVSGAWKEVTDSVNIIAASLSVQVRSIAEVTTSIANGDLSKKITVDAKGEILELKNTINTMVDRLNSFASEVTRVAAEVGTEGKLGGQGVVKGVSGTWKELTDNVNIMAANLTSQMRNIAEVTTAVAKGDLSKKITVDAKGEILELKNTINTMVDRLNSFASEVTRVAAEVGTEGKLGGQGVVKGVSGTWKELTDNVNIMAANLTSQMRNIAEVTTAVAKGDLSKKITVNAKGEILELKNTVNTMVDQLIAFSSEVTRVAAEVGTEGKLGGQGVVKGVSGTWKELTDNVNIMAANLTSQMRNISDVTTAVAKGDLSKKITVDAKGEIMELKITVNTMVDQLRAFSYEVTRVAREVGTEGKLGGQAEVQGVSGTWRELTENVNTMASKLTYQVRNIAKVTTAVANGDLSQKITVDASGEILELKNTINTMVDRLNTFASEVTRVSREVGTDGILGVQGEVKGISGMWKDLTDNVNTMAANLTDQVRGIAKIVTAVANGDLKQKLNLSAKGEIATLSGTINNMIDTLATFADQVTEVARLVGVEGRLGGQADVPGAAGTWRDLTVNVNQLAANLTNQVRAIAEVATAVTDGDLSRSITVDAKGELADLKNNINEMIRNLRETTTTNQEQDWLKTNIAKFTRMMQGQRDLLNISRSILSELCPLVGAAHGVFYIMERETAESPDGVLKMLASYGYRERKNVGAEWKVGEGLVGQAAFEKQRILLTNVPSDYIKITSGLGESTPLNIIVLPAIFEDSVKAVIELASFEHFSPIHQDFLEQLTESLGIVVNTIEAGRRTEDLLKQSQSMTEELQSQQEELQQTNEELEEKAHMLSDQNTEVERKNNEIEVARLELEKKAEQLVLTSKYKSEFMANMSHELRTPLNSLLILSQELAENSNGNLTDRQVEYASTIHASGTDLHNLINDILDLSKVESGTVTVDLEEVLFNELRDNMDQVFQPVAKQKKLEFEIDIDKSAPNSIKTDSKRLRQIIKNLLSNAFKFTEKGHVRLRIIPVSEGWSGDQYILNSSEKVIAIKVEDSGIGIPLDKQKIVFEAFQQADGSTSRKYGGTGLGLAISRELAWLLGGELIVDSETGKGSIFTLFLPKNYSGSFRLFEEAAQSHGDEGQTNDINNEYMSSMPAAVKKVSTTLPPKAGSKINTVPIDLGSVPDDRAIIKPNDQVLLIVEDDPKFSKILFDLAHDKGFKALVTDRGEEAFILAREFNPSAITLDIQLPDTDGWTVLDRIKIDPATRHIPVHIISVEEDYRYGLKHGAFACIKKPTSRTELDKVFDKLQTFAGDYVGQLLIVEGDDAERAAIIEVIGHSDIEITDVSSGKEALEVLNTKPFDCVVLDINLSDMDGFQVIERMRKEPALSQIPVIIFTSRDLSDKEEEHLQELAQSVIVKDVKSPERLLAETSLFLHRVVSQLPESKQRMIQSIYQSDTALVGKKVLIVDDDIRNIFALTSVMENHNMIPISAENGNLALEQLQKDSGIDIILMDVMMPEMDGYDTMRAIRKQPKYKKLPIIALTAKAMKGDREKCLEAGASDYIVKPVNIDQLLSLMRVWMYK